MTLEEAHARDIEIAKAIIAEDGECILTFVLDKPGDEGRVIKPLRGLPKALYYEIMRNLILKIGVTRYSYIAETWVVQKTIARDAVEATMKAIEQAGPIAKRDDRVATLFCITCEPGRTLTTQLRLTRDASGNATYSPMIDATDALLYAGNIHNYFDGQAKLP